MRGKQVAAFLAAIVLIAGAWLIRSQVIDGGEGSGSRSPKTARTVVCVSELEAICRQVLASRGDVTLRIESANSTLNERAAEPLPSDAIWITMQPFPAMVDNLRAGKQRVQTGASVNPIASSPLTLVVDDSRSATLRAACGDPVDWKCVGEAAGDPWTSLDEKVAKGDIRPAFAPFPESAIGQLGVTQAVLGAFGAGDPTADLTFITWALNLAKGANPSAVRGSTAVKVIQTRPPFDIAVGAEAELLSSNVGKFALVQASPAVSVDVVAVVPAGSSIPDGLAADLQDAFTAVGWDPPRTGPLGVSVNDMLLVRSVMEEFFK